MSLDDIGSDVLSRLGVHAIRLGIPYLAATAPDYDQQMKQLNAKLADCARHKITVMLMFDGSDGAPQPLGRGRPHLDDNAVMQKSKQDFAWLPEADPGFHQFVADVCRRYGWPKGPVTSVLLWNEPWEGFSISGWGADSLRYREIFTAMAEGVDDARTDGAQVLIAGCDSSTNTWDKLFPDGKDTFLKWLDVCTIHYQGLASPCLFREWLDRKSPQGRVKIWDTESWVANTDDRVATVVAADRAAGYDRSMGIYGGNITRIVHPATVAADGTELPEVHDTWPPAAAVGAVQHFIGERDFQELLFQQGLPWIMVFNGLGGDSDDGTAVVVGDLGEAFGANNLPFRQVRGLAEVHDKEALREKLSALPADSPDRDALEKQIATPGILSGGSLTVPAEPWLRLYDFDGNLVPPTDGKVVVPLDFRGFYLRTDGSKGSFTHLLEALRQARIGGYEPLEIIARDFTAPVDQGGHAVLVLHNILNRPVSGSLAVTLGGASADAPAQVSLSPFETKEIPLGFKGTPPADNCYPLSVHFDGGADGVAVHEETLHVNQIAHRTITVDGNLDDWKGVLPQAVHAKGKGVPSLTEAAWFPFAKFDAALSAGYATSYLAYDDKYFYFATKVADNTPDAGAPRFEKLDPDPYFYPQVSEEINPQTTLESKVETWTSPLRMPGALLLPDGAPDARTMQAWSSVAQAFAFDLSPPPGGPTRVSLYFVDWDPYIGADCNGRRRVEVIVTDPQTNHVLAKQVVASYGLGNYVSFDTANPERITIRTSFWLSASLSGIFFDPTPAGTQVVAGKVAFTAPDLTTAGNWKSKYGTLGYSLPGLDPKLPAGASLREVVHVDMKEHAWPDGVRHYSYRKNPILPSGNSPNFDNVQVAFNVLSPDQKRTIPFAPGTMPGFVTAETTDYEFALNQVGEAYGGGTEIWKLLVPGMPRKNFYPRQPTSPCDGPVRDGKLVIRQDGNMRIVEAAIPWSEIPEVQQAQQQGKTVKFSFRVNDDKGVGMELAEDRSVSELNPMAFHAEWVTHWANEIEFGFEK